MDSSDGSAVTAEEAARHADRLKERPEEAWAEILRRLNKNEAPVRGMFAIVNDLAGLDGAGHERP